VTTVLRNARLLGRAALADVVVDDATVVQISDTVLERPGVECVDLGGRVLLPGFVDAHVHLDKAFLNDDPRVRGTTGAAFFDTLRVAKTSWTRDALRSRMRRALEACARYGTTSIRAQVDVDEVVGLQGIEAALELREACADLMSMQIVAFPQEGFLSNPIAMDLMREAMRLGADVVGGGAAFDRGMTPRHVAALFELATEFDRDLDVHADLQTEPTAALEQWEVWHVAERAREAGWHGRVSVGHMTQLGQMAPERAADVAALLADAGISVTVVPGAELNTATTWEASPARVVDEAMSRLDVLLEQGVNLGYATGHLADPFSPYGRGDMLLDGLVLACARNLGLPRIAGTHILELATTHPAQTLRLGEPYAVCANSRADLVCLDAVDPDLALRHPAVPFMRMRGGHLTHA
jgi:cytosine deaminase